MEKLPNMLTMARVVLIPLIVLLFFFKGTAPVILCGLLFIVAAVTDYFDGYFARTYKITSSFGRFLDPIADKLLVAAALFMLAATNDLVLLGVVPALVILCREIIVSGLREYLAEIQIGMPVSRLAKWKTGMQLTAIPVMIFGQAWTPFAYLGVLLLWVAAILTIMTGWDYLTAGLKYMDTKPDKPLKNAKDGARGKTKAKAKAANTTKTKAKTKAKSGAGKKAKR